MGDNLTGLTNLVKVRPEMAPSTNWFGIAQSEEPTDQQER
jgi:hypothetical protein